MIYEPKPFEIAGVELFGRRQKDGSIIIGDHPGTPLDDFPKEIKVEGAIYTLENIKVNKEISTIPPEHAGYNIEWGEYV